MAGFVCAAGRFSSRRGEAPAPRLLCLLQWLANLLKLRKAAQLFLAEDAAAIQVDLEDPAPRGDDLQRGDLVLVSVQDLLRQTDGFRKIASGGAVLDADLHHFSSHSVPPRRSLGRRSPFLSHFYYYLSLSLL